MVCNKVWDSSRFRTKNKFLLSLKEESQFIILRTHLSSGIWMKKLRLCCKSLIRKEKWNKYLSNLWTNEVSLKVTPCLLIREIRHLYKMILMLPSTRVYRRTKRIKSCLFWQGLTHDLVNYLPEDKLKVIINHHIRLFTPKKVNLSHLNNLIQL